MHSGGSAQFQPAPEAVPAILQSLGRADISFNDIADALHTTPEALAIWMTSPDIRERLEATDRVVTWRTRMVASTSLAAAVAALESILQDFNHSRATRGTRATDRGLGGERSVQEAHDPASTPTSPNPTNPPTPDPTTTLRAAMLQVRQVENARKAAAALIRLAHLRPNTYARVEADAAYRAAPSTAAQREAAQHQPAPDPDAVIEAALALTRRAPITTPEHHAQPITPNPPAAPAPPATADEPNPAYTQPPQPYETPAPTSPPAHAAPTPDAPAHTAHSPADQAATFDHLLSQIFDLAAQNPDLLNKLAAIADDPQSAPPQPELQPQATHEHWP